MRKAAKITAILTPGLLLLGLVGWIAYHLGWSLPHLVTVAGRPRVMSEAEYEQWARTQFYEKSPGEKPLNWRIARVAVQYYEERPMGKFVLHENDCSDFVDCIVDDAIGPGARFRRDPQKHVVPRMYGIFKSFYWQQGDPVIPGDIISARHSPWYPPKESAISHIGVVGADGQVYDFVKLRSWSAARYGRNSFPWFVRHCPDAGEVTISRLRPEYRFKLKEIPGAGQRKASSQPRQGPL